MTSTTRPGSARGGDGHDESTEFLLQSLRDLEAERAAGDLDEDDYLALRDDYTARAAAALRAEQRGAAAPATAPTPRPRGQRILVLAGIIGFALLAGVLVAYSVGDRKQGESVTGEVTQTPTQAASDCIDLTVAGEMVDAVPCYQDVLDDDPGNAVAHTYLGWTLFLSANQAGGALPEETIAELYAAAHSQMDQAVEADPGYADARAFQVVLAAREARWEDAAANLKAFDELDAPADMARLIDSQRQRIADGLAGDGPAPDASTPDGATPSTSEPAPTTAPG